VVTELDSDVEEFEVEEFEAEEFEVAEVDDEGLNEGA
jgi:hypothetical protein